MKAKVVKAFAYAIGAIGIIASGSASMGCLIIWLDEQEMPKCMIEEQ